MTFVKNASSPLCEVYSVQIMLVNLNYGTALYILVILSHSFYFGLYIHECFTSLPSHIATYYLVQVKTTNLLYGATLHIWFPMHYLVTHKWHSMLLPVKQGYYFEKNDGWNQIKYVILNSSRLENQCWSIAGWWRCNSGHNVYHDDVIKWKHFPRYWPFVRGTHRSPVNSPIKGQWRGALMFTLICTWTLNKRLSKQSWVWWFEMPSRPLWRHCNVTDTCW